ncbi:E3 ubiquitin-protein ligase TRIM11-like [Lacerta agilis]|uniref:E3 ubiquitin-protein ligase TRIM11-like n=1 Tax=Lacerta agilis TaxID=80427 RepID=UPI00141A3C1E|nr:E3 ubiquitin-protein ligase TRIM11-like [Lacerta agilis]
MAAAGGPVQSLCDEVTCSICQDYFKDPVTIAECGDNFCRTCLVRHWRKLEAVAFCPQCKIIVKRRSLISNQHLAKVVEIAKKLSLHLQEGQVCEMHWETLKLFCKDHETPICVVCHRSKEHENHKVLPLEEASEEYKGEICNRLEILRKERETILASQADLEKKSQDLLKLTKSEKQRTVEKFRQMCQFLKEQEKCLLNEIEEVEKEIARRRNKQLDRLSRKLSSLERIIQEMEEKRQKPASELLQVVRSTFERYEKRKSSKISWAFPPQLKGKISRFCDIDRIIDNAMKEFKDSLLFRQLLQEAHVTLDPDTTHPRLILSQDQKSVRWGDKEQVLPDNPERFNELPSVLGREGFTAGRHFWEVNVESGIWWAVGVARKSVRRKGSHGCCRGPVQSLCDEVTCSICQDYFKDPVTIAECGDNFCRTCLVRHWRKLEAVAFCPQCKIIVKRRSLISNQHLAKVVEIAKKLSLHLQEGQVCEMHWETLKLFCKDHETPICVVCHRSKEHENHKVLPLEEASEEYKGEICNRLEILRKERETILASQADLEKKSQDLLKLTKSEKQRTVEKFRQMCQFLKEQEKCLLNEIEEVEKEIARRRNKQLDRLSRKLSSLERIIQEMEEKRQKPASELLQVVRSTFERYEKRKSSKISWAFPPQLKGKISRFCDIDRIIDNAMKEFKDSLLFRQLLQEAHVTLDPDTTHPRLILSQDQKSVRWGDKEQVLPDNPERFNELPSVLGREGFTAGRHFWEVNVESGIWWAVGVARKSVRRKGVIALSPEGGIWVMGRIGEYMAFTSPDSSPLSLREKPKRIRVTLDYERGHVSFSDADSGAKLYMFSEASFSGETLLPFFYLRGEKTHLRIS